MILNMFPPLIMMLSSIILALLAMAFYTLMERKLLGYWQLRKGPNKVMLMGVPQPFADAIKLFIKERSTPSPANNTLFYLSPALALSLTIFLWAIFPHHYSTMFMTYGILYFLCISSLNVYAIFLSGWSANSKYAMLGSLRSIAQTISYEVSMALILISALILLKSMDLHLITFFQTPLLIMMMPIMMMWFITNLAETNRSPFDLAEGESELVSGFNIEYSAGLFAFIFMAEYANILFMSLLTSILFLSSNPMIPLTLLLKTILLATLFIWVRATLPRMRYDNLMILTWKSFLPIILSSILILMSLI